jgi:hypothetical protein
MRISGQWLRKPMSGAYLATIAGRRPVSGKEITER